MADHIVTFDVKDEKVSVPTGTLLSEAARSIGVEIAQPCGGQGRCGRCAVRVIDGIVRRRSTLRLTELDIADGFALACQTVVEGDVSVSVPPQEKIERRLTTDRTVADFTIPVGYDVFNAQTLRRVNLTLIPPSMDDQIDDWSRLQTALRQQVGIESNGHPILQISLPLLKKLGPCLREKNWEVTAWVDIGQWDCPECPAHLIDLAPGHTSIDEPLWGAAVDIGTTTVTVLVIDLLTGKVHSQAAEYNQQITRGEDVISRIIYSMRNHGAQELQELVIGTINQLFERACKRARADQKKIYKVTVAGNSTMMHLLLGIPAESIRLAPFVTVINLIPTLNAQDVGFAVHPNASVDCLPGVASYVGADISAGVLSSGVDDTDNICLFLDIGTNGEIVLGSRDWLAACACSAGPAFEGAGVLHGMRATKGAIEEVWINGETFEPTFRVIGETLPAGICGSGLISLIAELFLTGIIDKGGNFNLALPTARVRTGEHNDEYVLVWAKDSSTGEDISVTRVDIDNLLRAKAAIYAGYTILAESVGIPLEMASQVLIGGSFGKYINVEKAVEIGLLPDMPWDNFKFLGNTSVRGAYLGLLDRKARARIKDIASRMTYIELSADNSFYEAFTSALFLPHTDLTKFPSVKDALDKLLIRNGVP